MRHGKFKRCGKAFLKRIYGVQGRQEFYLSLRLPHLLLIRKLLTLAECYDCPNNAGCNKEHGPCRELEKILEEIQ